VTTIRFFEKPTQQSLVKIKIVSKYFATWGNIIAPKTYTSKVNYIDLFAGPGQYDDGTKSTPVLILENAISNPILRDRLVSVFNDKHTDYYKSLKANINSITGIDTLHHKPTFMNVNVNERLVKELSNMKLNPTLSFLDPYGYKGLSLELINSLIKDWGSDCIFFFNYRRINAGLSNQFLKSPINPIFGKRRAEKLREELGKIEHPVNRERKIVEELGQALTEITGNYVLEFSFRNDSGSRIIHHLIFVTKGVKGFEVMKEIMAGESSSDLQGVASFEFNPNPDTQLPLIERPLDDLQDMLLRDFQGQSLTMFEVYNKHHVKPPYIYIKRNYKDALRRLEERGLIKALPPVKKRRKRQGKVTFSDSVRVVF